MGHRLLFFSIFPKKPPFSPHQCRMAQKNVKAGDTVMYVSGLRHQGLGNRRKKIQRISFDFVTHSLGRYFYDSERIDRNDIWSFREKSKLSALEMRHQFEELVQASIQRKKNYHNHTTIGDPTKSMD